MDSAQNERVIIVIPITISLSEISFAGIADG